MVSGFDVDGNPTITRPLFDWPKIYKIPAFPLAPLLGSQTAKFRFHFGNSSVCTTRRSKRPCARDPPKLAVFYRGNSVAAAPNFTCNSVPSGQSVRSAEAHGLIRF